MQNATLTAVQWHFRTVKICVFSLIFFHFLTVIFVRKLASLHQNLYTFWCLFDWKRFSDIRNFFVYSFQFRGNGLMCSSSVVLWQWHHHRKKSTQCTEWERAFILWWFLIKYSYSISICIKTILVVVLLMMLLLETLYSSTCYFIINSKYKFSILPFV